MRGAFSVSIVAAAASLMLPASPAQAVVVEVFPPTGAEQTFAVPAGVHKLTVGVLGGKGGGTADASGGSSAAVIAPLSVTPGQTLYIEVGGNGKTKAQGGAGGFNGGGAAAEGGSGGGGASDIRTTPRADGLTPDTRLIISAGGGGAGGTGTSSGGKGGEAGHDGGSATGSAAGAGGAKGSAGGGAGGAGCNEDGENGDLGLGGAGSAGEAGDEGGGGGGGGLFGGGGGGGGCAYGGGGGGGGSDLVPPGGARLPTALDPRIEIAYWEPPTISISSPPEGATIPQGQVVNASYACSSAENVPIKTCTGSIADGAALDTSSLGPHTLTVEAEDTERGTAAKSVTYTVVPAPPAPPPPAFSAPLPETRMTAHPKKTVKTKKKKAKVKFSFSSDVPGATFQCKLDKGAFAPCTSPKSYKVKRGSHKFSVAAGGPGGTDPTPATFRFKVEKKK